MRSRRRREPGENGLLKPEPLRCAGRFPFSASGTRRAWRLEPLLASQASLSGCLKRPNDFLRTGSPRVPSSALPQRKKPFQLFTVRACFLWSQHADLNRGPTDYESVALPAELCWRIDRWPIQGESIACPRFKVKPFSFWRNKRCWGRLAALTASGARAGRKGRL